MAVSGQKVSALDEALAREKAGDMAGAEAGFRAVLEGDPDHPNALLLLGALLHKTGRAEEAVGLIERALDTAPRRGRTPPPAWRVALAHAKRDAGDGDGALAIVDALVAEAPGALEPLMLRADLLQRLERHEEAVRDYRRLLDKAPGYSPALNNMGVSLKALDRLKEAYESFARAAEEDPKNTQAIMNVGMLMLDMGDAQAAVGHLRRAHALDRGDRKIEDALIDALQVAEQVGEAERLAEAAHARDPDDVVAMVRLGNIRMVLGRRDSAVALARRGRELAPRGPGVLSLLAEADREADAAALLADIESVLAERQGFGHTIGLHFAAARLCEKLKRHPEAFDHYVRGNAARREQLQRLEKGYDRDRAAAETDRLIAAFADVDFDAPGGSSSEVPVFIVGMPRSGTSLTEQVLASHPSVAGAGELREVGMIVRWLRAQHGYPETLPAAPLKEAADGYLRHVGRVGRGALRVTDKMPGNFQHLGLIARLFPRARIIHCRRDPMDNCLSCFAQNFRADGLAWSCELGDLAHQYCQYRRFMEHWRRVLPPGRMLEIDYEDTVADFEAQARRILDFVDLPWDDACLEFYKTERAVATASREQVRNPIYRSSVGRWKRYGDGVLPLARGLESCGCGPAAGDC